MVSYPFPPFRFTFDDRDESLGDARQPLVDVLHETRLRFTDGEGRRFDGNREGFPVDERVEPRIEVPEALRLRALLPLNRMLAIASGAATDLTPAQTFPPVTGD